MSAIGKGSLSLRKRDISNSRSASTGFVKVVFAHKATGGETSISLTSLVAPPEMLANGFVQPSSSLLSDLNIYNYRQNLTLRSSVRGELWDYLSYSVASNSVINFLGGITLLPNEVIEGIIDNAPRDGLMVVDGQSIVSTGTLASGQTDFNVGTPFEIFKYPTQQIGAVKVYRNGLLQARCEGNVTTGDGNYIEVPVTGGFGTLIRFKTAAANNADNIIVTSNGAYFERPNDSMMASIETLAGQMDKVIQVLADASGQPSSAFQSNPNNVNLRQFGDTVISNTTRISALEADYSKQSFLSFSSPQQSFGSAGVYPAFTGNSVTLSAGDWELFGSVFYTNNGSPPNFTFMSSTWSFTNGAGTSSFVPLGVNSTYNVSAIAGQPNSILNANSAINLSQVTLTIPTVRITVTAPVTVYLISLAAAGTIANAQMFASGYVKKVK